MISAFILAAYARSRFDASRIAVILRRWHKSDTVIACRAARNRVHCVWVCALAFHVAAAAATLCFPITKRALIFAVSLIVVCARVKFYYADADARARGNTNADACCARCTCVIKYIGRG